MRNILAVDATKEKTFSLSLVSNGSVLIDQLINGSFTDNFFEAIKVLSLDSLDCLAVNTGPGSYTGIRASISALKGLSIVSDTPLIGLDSLSILENHFEEQIKQCRKTAMIVISGHRDSFFYCREIARNESTNHVKKNLISLEELEKMRNDPEIVIIGDYGYNGCDYQHQTSAVDLARILSFKIFDEENNVTQLYHS